MELNRTQQFLLNAFENDLNNEEFEDLKFIINKFFISTSEINSFHKINRLKQTDLLFNDKDGYNLK